METPREIHLSLMGDWGVANWHQLMGWMAANLRWATSSDSTFTIQTFGPYKDTLQRLFDGSADACISSPTATVDMAIRGVGSFQGQPHPELCAVGVYPHPDAYLIAIAEEVAEREGLRTLGDFAERRPRLNLVGAERNGINLISWTTERVFEKYGFDWDSIPAWGGSWIWNEQPIAGLMKIGTREADGLCFEAIMTWHRLHERRPLRFFGIDPGVVEALGQEYGLKPYTIEAGYFKGQEEPITSIDFSDWLLAVRRDLPHPVAYLMAKILVENRQSFEYRYADRPPKESPLRVPIDPKQVGHTEPVPLHPGAEAYYREVGLL